MILISDSSRKFTIPFELSSRLLTDEERGFLVSIYFEVLVSGAVENPPGKESLIESCSKKGFMTATEMGYKLVY